MPTHHDLWIAARARRQLIEAEIATWQPAPRRRSTRAALLLANLLQRLSGMLLESGGRLQRYADRSLAQAGGQRREERAANPC